MSQETKDLIEACKAAIDFIKDYENFSGTTKNILIYQLEKAIENAEEKI